jgi:hypothetical protein
MMGRLTRLGVAYASFALAVAVLLHVAGVEARWGAPVIVLCLSAVQLFFWALRD